MQLVLIDVSLATAEILESNSGLREMPRRRFVNFVSPGALSRVSRSFAREVNKDAGSDGEGIECALPNISGSLYRKCAQMYEGCTDTASRVLNIGTRCNWVASFTPRPRLPHTSPAHSVVLFKGRGWRQTPDVVSIGFWRRCSRRPDFAADNWSSDLKPPLLPPASFSTFIWTWKHS